MYVELKLKNVYGIITLLATCLLSTSIVDAQPLPDQTLPNDTEVNSEGNTYQINGGTVAGNNLFHSFKEFSVPTGKEASFNNDLAIQNVISRVTGESISTIDGVISANGTADLFLINPNGIIFGANASLNVGGSLLVTTADSLQFADGTEFIASNPQAFPLLTISTPTGLQFGSQVGSITNQSGQLTLEDLDSTIAFIGGDINLEGGTIANLTGNIELGSVASNSQVDLVTKDLGWTFDYQNVQNYQDISLIQTKILKERESDFPTVLFANNIKIRGEKVTIRDGRQIFVGKTLQINASDTLKLSGSVPSDLNNDLSFSGLVSEAFSKADGGDILINTGQLIIQDGARISSKVSGKLNSDTMDIDPARGNGGDININASESVLVRDEGSGIFSATEGFGSAGKITIQTKNLFVENGAVISAESTGETDLGQSLSTGSGGQVQIDASKSIRLDSGFISSSTKGLGSDAGNLRLKTDRLSVLNDAEISVGATGTGKAGSLTIDAQEVNLDHGSLNAETRVGNQGNITLNNAQTLLLRNNSQITTNASESATGGDITISSDAIALLDGSDITANAITGRGGNINITTQGIFQEPDSQITAASELGIDGTVTLNTPDVDPAAGIFELPDVPIDTAKILAQDFCRLEDNKIAKGSSFIVTGRGGLTPTSEESLENSDRLVNWARRDDLKVSDNGAVGIRQREEADITSQREIEIKQSQELVVAEDGSVWLTANIPETVPQNASNVYPDCGNLNSDPQD